VPLTEACRLVIDNNPTLLHISDTPSQLYPELARIIRILKPDYIIHTGDLVDNLKLQIHPSLQVRYERELKCLFKIMENSIAKKIYFSLGNHDDPAVVLKLAGRIQVFANRSQLKLSGIDIDVSHYPPPTGNQNGSTSSCFYLYGHDLNLPSHQTDSAVYLNGIEAMHFINLKTGQYIALNYPLGTDSARLNYHRIRL